MTVAVTVTVSVPLELLTELYGPMVAEPEPTKDWLPGAVPPH